MNFHADTQTRLILASRSPRRAELLRDAGLSIEQIESPFVDPLQPNLAEFDTAIELAAALAMEKAKALAPEIEGKAVIIAADTICVDTENQLIGTPCSRDDASDMIKTFRSAIHYVVTGAVVLAVDAEQQNDDGDYARPIAMTPFADEAIVMLGHIEDAEIERYLDLDTWKGKAGGYNLTERQAAGWPIVVNGDPTTVVGLPIEKTMLALKKYNIKPI
ncbi:Maf-like protein YhdE [Poriferisphaera corsica]|uniref:Nucleoside triphosphate pyrophosphatase n=1 Tax=Poriferisphaera corsica TaxID=2528020 RepID=A0A517YZC1_9BACT|nr:Maf family protein [Poriferisphaera corsica]QDU35588.1 Maf-like protein YhdE [Poriferisphaera corsica]